MFSSIRLIYYNRESAVKSEGSFTHPHWKHPQSFWEALSFVIVKGIEAHMPPLFTSLEVGDSEVAGMVFFLLSFLRILS